MSTGKNLILKGLLRKLEAILNKHSFFCQVIAKKWFYNRLLDKSYVVDENIFCDDYPCYPGAIKQDLLMR